MYYVISSDYHANAPALDKILTKFSGHEYQLVLMGDFFDSHGGDAKAMATVLKDLVEGKYKLPHEPIILMGNHDSLFLETAHGSMLDWKTWDANGMHSTLHQLGFKESFHSLQKIQDFLHNNYQYILDIFENASYQLTTPNFLAVHAGIDWDKVLDTSNRDSIWIRDDYIFGTHPRRYHTNDLGMPIITGHTPTRNFQDSDDIMVLKSSKEDVPRYLIDGGSKAGKDYQGQVNVLLIKEDDSNDVILINNIENPNYIKQHAQDLPEAPYYAPELD